MGSIGELGSFWKDSNFCPENGGFCGGDHQWGVLCKVEIGLDREISVFDLLFHAEIAPLD